MDPQHQEHQKSVSRTRDRVPYWLLQRNMTTNGVPTGLPNLPVPVNGMIKTYDSGHRNFARPYSAKTVFFYKEGDDRFAGVRLPISKARYRTMDALLDDLTNHIPLDYGVRRVFTPEGKTEVQDPNKLAHMGTYVCSSNKWARKINLSAIERMHHWKKEAASDRDRIHRRVRSHGDTVFASSVAALKQKEKNKRLTNTQTPPVAASTQPKQVLFIMNSPSGKAYRVQLKGNRLPTMEQLLQEISQNWETPIHKIFTLDGKKVLKVDEIFNGGKQFIATERHVRPQMNGEGLANSRFPTIRKTYPINHVSQNSDSRKLRPEAKPPKPQSLKGSDKGSVNSLPPVNKPPRIQNRRRIPRANSEGAKKTSKKNVRRSKSEEKDSNSPDESKAASKIQAGVRGYLTRKHLNVPPPEADFEDQEQAAKKIQAVYRGFSTRKRIKKVPGDRKVKEKTKKTKKTKKPSKVLYTVSIFTGNRWGADFDSDLFLVIKGSEAESGSLSLHQNEIEPKFQQNQVDTFDVESPYVGRIESITIGHKEEGYGAGIYVERVMISDTSADMYQYAFFCGQWLDSGQVDGKIERTLPSAGYYDLSKMPESTELEDSEDPHSMSKGRWLLKVNPNMDIAAPSASLSVVAFGSYGKSESILLDSAHLSEQQVDFGDFGDLYKIRMKSDGTGDSPEFYLDSLLIEDQDTGEVIDLFCKKWLSASKDGGQLFRELSVVRVGVEPLAVMNYAIRFKVKGSHGAVLPGKVSIQLVGEYGDSGCITKPLSQPNGKEFSCSLECVALGRLAFISTEWTADDVGENISEGFVALQDIYDRHGVAVATGNEWLVEKIVVRESAHAPYQFIFTDSRVLESSHPASVKKQIILTEMEGLETRAKRPGKSSAGSTNSKSGGSEWTVTVVTGEQEESGTNGIPMITLCGSRGNSKPEPLKISKDPLSPGSTSVSEIRTKFVGRIRKIRLHLEPSKEEPKPTWFIKKIKLREKGIGEELRFPVEMWLDSSTPVELSAVWPDIPPNPSITYQVTVKTGKNSDSTADIAAFLTIVGENGSTGQRALRAAGADIAKPFQPASTNSFDIEAVSLGKLKEVEVSMEGSDRWFLDKLIILDSESATATEFNCNDWITSEKKKKITTAH